MLARPAAAPAPNLSSVKAPLRYAASIVVRPFATWRAIAAEPISLGALVAGYALPLALVGPIATFAARRLVGVRIGNVIYRSSVGEAFAQAAFSFVLVIAGLFLVAAIVALLAPAFGARRSAGDAFRVATFAYTPVWLAGVFVLLPAFGFVQLLALAYEIYLLHAGLATVMGVGRAKAGGLAACAVVGAILLAVGFGALSAAFGLVGSADAL